MVGRILHKSVLPQKALVRPFPAKVRQAEEHLVQSSHWQRLEVLD